MLYIFYIHLFLSTLNMPVASFKSNSYGPSPGHDLEYLCKISNSKQSHILRFRVNLSLGDMIEQLQDQTQHEMLLLCVSLVCDTKPHENTFLQVRCMMSGSLPFLFPLLCISLLCFPRQFHVYFDAIYASRHHVFMRNLGVTCEKGIDGRFLSETGLIPLI